MSSNNFTHLRILIGEDHELIRDFLAQIFDLLNVKRIDIVEDGEKVISYAQESEYDLILLDINMPKKSGYEVARLKANFMGNPTLVALTANADQSTKNLCKASGMSEIILKPVTLIDLEDLLSKISVNLGAE